MKAVRRHSQMRAFAFAALLSIYGSSQADQAPTANKVDARALGSWCLSSEPTAKAFCDGYTQAVLDAYNKEIQGGKSSASPENQKCWQRIYDDPGRQALLDAAKYWFLRLSLITIEVEKNQNSMAESPQSMMMMSVSTLCVAEKKNPGAAIGNMAKSFAQMAAEVQAQNKK